jgi:hypothetical protein
MKFRTFLCKLLVTFPVSNLMEEMKEQQRLAQEKREKQLELRRMKIEELRRRDEERRTAVEDRRRRQETEEMVVHVALQHFQLK